SFHGRRLGTFGDIAIFSFLVTKAMTTGEGGIAVTNDPELYKRCQAAHDVGHSEDYEGLRGGQPTVLWGLGTVMSELQGAMGLVQLSKLDQIVGSLRRTKYRLREALSSIPGIAFRRVEDPAGDNGSFLITRYQDPATATRMAQALRELGLEGGPDGKLVHYLPEWGFHVYSNIPQLVQRLSNSPDGFPWTHPANAESRYSYARGALPQSDELFARSVLQMVPSNSTDEDVQDMIAIYRRAAEMAGVE
ncbi:MAG: DegT/DnrJ/EryC1/StrS family aminotransferase, partial [Deltaproteobacteria bacterium]|nr:DegT/DnrJ/EryC1/StrS family aminotransferase [Deltaproteobacteria bacterium]